jgi:hypothetical protein
MTRNPGAARASALLLRWLAWLLPTSRKDWAEAMINELEATNSRRAAFDWAIGCLFVALRERIHFEAGRSLMRRRVLQVAIGLAATLFLACAGIYATAKPYQRVRLQQRVANIFSPAQDK